MSARSSVDVLIVGQGMAGSLLAVNLLDRGMRIRVVDAGFSSATQAALGVLNPVLGARLRRVEGFDELYEAAFRTYRELEGRISVPLFHETPITRIWSSGEQRSRFEEAQASGAYADLVISGIEAGVEEGVLRCPFGGAVLRGGAWVDGERLLAGIRELLRARRSFEPARFSVSEARMAGDLVVWRRLTARRIVFCQGASLAVNPLFSRMGFSAVRGESLTIDAPQLRRALAGRIVGGGVTIIPGEEGRLRVGSTYDHSVPPAEAEGRCEPSAAARGYLIERLASLVSADFTVVDQTAAFRSTLPDRRPAMGFHPTNPAYAVFGAFASRGFSLAPYWAERFALALERSCSRPAAQDGEQADLIEAAVSIKRLPIRGSGSEAGSAGAP